MDWESKIMKIKNLSIILAAAAALVLTSCQKKVVFSHGIGLMSEFNILGAENGNTPILVFSNSTWTASFATPVSWASLDRVSGTGNGNTKFYYEVNYGRSRSVAVVFTGGGETRQIVMWQKPAISDDQVVLTMAETEAEAPKGGKTVSVGFDTNLIYQKEEIFCDVQYPEGGAAGWITSTTVDPSTMTVNIVCAPNASASVRSAIVRIGHTDAGSYNATSGAYTAPVTIWSDNLVIKQSSVE